MNKKALILDLDNTIYPVPSIGDELFKPLFDLITDCGEYKGEFEEIKKDMMRIPFQKVAKKYEFSEQLTEKGDQLLKDLTYDKEMSPFEDYATIRDISCKKFLVTTGYTKMQQSKVDRLGLEKDFDEVHIVDPSISGKTKKDIFKDILDRHGFDATDVLVVGDDPESEIKAGKELGIDTVLYTKNVTKTEGQSISDFSQLKEFL
ncbi:HAD family hydrolase [Pontibacter korlensis]|uniref:Haloacid dehalogenase n=1 Tax=Pontibacter korlensis TaxID=400092 RepID=A0A0E3UYS6_9BACT|nr:HAD family hydrolase [Pontibacter korlensis]AKD04706.1 haloacid dehalogenase [Pontibacter korlensis]